MRRSTVLGCALVLLSLLACKKKSDYDVRSEFVSSYKTSFSLPGCVIFDSMGTLIVSCQNEKVGSVKSALESDCAQFAKSKFENVSAEGEKNPACSYDDATCHNKFRASVAGNCADWSMAY